MPFVLELALSLLLSEELEHGRLTLCDCHFFFVEPHILHSFYLLLVQIKEELLEICLRLARRVDDRDFTIRHLSFQRLFTSLLLFFDESCYLGRIVFVIIATGWHSVLFTGV